jgi:hypothetical protein
MPGPAPMDPASLQAASVSLGNIAPGGGGGPVTIVVDPGALQAASQAFSSVAAAISSTVSRLSGVGQDSVGIADPGCDGAYGMAISGLGSVLGGLSRDCDQTASALATGSGMYVATDNAAMRPG